MKSPTPDEAAQRAVTNLFRDTIAAREAVYRAAQSTVTDERYATGEAQLVAYKDLERIAADVNRVRVMLRAPYPT